jgi:UDPglucose 6-dehydrogenase
MTKQFKTSFIGVGKLGQACAEMVAEVHDVVGYDINHREPENFSMVGTLAEAVIGRDIVFIAVETPHDPQYDGKAPTSHLPNKDFDYTVVETVLKQVNSVATQHQLIVLISTVLPGTVRSRLANLISNARFVYNPYLIAMGTVKWDMVNPEMVMIGTQDGSETGDAKLIREIYTTIMQNDPRYVIGTWEEIESLKVFYNTFISAKISLVNMIQDTAERLGHMNADVVCDALAASNRRIMGPSYMKPGLGDAGACHPRDNIALRYMAERLDLGYDLFDSVMRSREVQAENMAKRLVQLADGKMPVVIIGKAYKPLVPYTAGSSSMLVGHYVEEMDVPLYYHDYNTGDRVPEEILSQPAVYLTAHDPDVTYGDQLDHVREFMKNRHVSDADQAFTAVGGLDRVPAPGSVILDPWRKVVVDPELQIQVVHYGNTRPQN